VPQLLGARLRRGDHEWLDSGGLQPEHHLPRLQQAHGALPQRPDRATVGGIGSAGSSGERQRAASSSRSSQRHYPQVQLDRAVSKPAGASQGAGEHTYPGGRHRADQAGVRRGAPDHLLEPALADGAHRGQDAPA